MPVRLKFNGFFESPFFKIIIAPLMVASIAGLIILYGAVNTIQGTMKTATIRRDEQFAAIERSLKCIEMDIKMHTANYSGHVPMEELRKIFREK
jgi:hypothetical protein